MTPTRWAALASLLLMASVGVVVWLHVVGPLPGDRAWVDHVHDHHRDGMALNVTFVFSVIGYAPVAAAILLVAWRVTATRVSPGQARLVVLAGLAPVLSTTFKAIAGPVPLGERAFGPGAPGSYPSGHVAFATGLFGYLAVLAARSDRRGVASVMVALVVLMGPMRVIAGAHLPSDVVGGYLVGLGWLAAILGASAGGRRAEPARVGV